MDLCNKEHAISLTADTACLAPLGFLHPLIPTALGERNDCNREINKWSLYSAAAQVLIGGLLPDPFLQHPLPLPLWFAERTGRLWLVVQLEECLVQKDIKYSW